MRVTGKVSVRVTGRVNVEVPRGSMLGLQGGLK